MIVLVLSMTPGEKTLHDQEADIFIAKRELREPVFQAEAHRDVVFDCSKGKGFNG